MIKTIHDGFYYWNTYVDKRLFVPGPMLKIHDTELFRDRIEALVYVTAEHNLEEKYLPESSILALTFWGKSSNTNCMSNTIIRLDLEDWPLMSPSSREAVVAHEAGHTLGFLHNHKNQGIMRDRIFQNLDEVPSPSPEELRLLKANY